MARADIAAPMTSARSRDVTDQHIRLRTRSPDETQAVAAIIADQFVPGDVVVLSGELGAGKTCFVQGAARQLGVTDRVTSPTFNLVRTYPHASIPITHCDVYRLNRLHDVLDLGDEVLAADAVTFVEWGDAILSLLPDDRIDVDVLLVDPAQDDGDRNLVLTLQGRWRERGGSLRQNLTAWLNEGTG